NYCLDGHTLALVERGNMRNGKISASVGLPRGEAQNRQVLTADMKQTVGGTTWLLLQRQLLSLSISDIAIPGWQFKLCSLLVYLSAMSHGNGSIIANRSRESGNSVG